MTKTDTRTDDKVWSAPLNNVTYVTIVKCGDGLSSSCSKTIIVSHIFSLNRIFRYSSNAKHTVRLIDVYRRECVESCSNLYGSKRGKWFKGTGLRPGLKENDRKENRWLGPSSEIWSMMKSSWRLRAYVINIHNKRRRDRMKLAPFTMSYM